MGPGALAVIEHLRAEVRRSGRTIADLAGAMKTSEPTLRRWLRGKGLTLEIIDGICAELDLDLRDLLDQQSAQSPDRFTLAQERVLASDRGLSLVFFSLLHGAGPAIWTSEFEISPARVARYLEKLRRLNLIDLRGERIRPRVARDVRWMPGGPLAIAFNRTIAPLFLNTDFGAAETSYVSDMIRLSPSARERVEVVIRKAHDDIRLIEEQDRGVIAGAAWFALLFLARRLTPQELAADLRRTDG